MLGNLDGGSIFATMNHIFHLPEALDLMISPADRTSEQTQEAKGFVPAAVDIKQTPKEYIFYVDVPGLTKSDIQVYVEEKKVLVLKCQGGKRKREGENEEEECKILRLERKTNRKFERRFTLPGDSNVAEISAVCQDGVLTVKVPRILPSQKSKTVQITVN
eukprot:TRINITY_DN29465_c0_g1_i1.p1 TRINITY_DN29465_c0_g1~~TRINITY_DN29465_c0_g1_i1.p1  ORF type:complete len:161 (-),score=9.10 TRINITY_DN29465_c0_g1_i1:329-811(-)